MPGAALGVPSRWRPCRDRLPGRRDRRRSGQRRRATPRFCARPHEHDSAQLLSSILQAARLRPAGGAALLPLPRRPGAQRPGARTSWSAWSSLRRSSSRPRSCSAGSPRTKARRRSSTAKPSATLSVKEANEECAEQRKTTARNPSRGFRTESGSDRRSRPANRARSPTTRPPTRSPKRRWRDRRRLRLRRRARPRHRPRLHLPLRDADRPADPLLGLARDGPRRRRPVGFFQFTLIWFVYFGLLVCRLGARRPPPAWDAGEAMPWPTPGEKAAAELEPESGTRLAKRRTAEASRSRAQQPQSDGSRAS